MVKFLYVIVLSISLSCSKQEEASVVDSGANQKEPLKVLARVDNASPTNLDRIRYTIEFSYIDGVEFNIPEPGADIAGFRIVDMGREGPKSAGIRKKLTLWYDLEPDVEGTYILPPVSVSYKFDDEEKAIHTNPIYISVAAHEQEETDRLIEDTGLARISDDRYWFYSVVAGGAILVVLLIIFALKRYSARKAVVPPVPPHEMALRSLRELLASGFIEKSDYRNFYFRLSEIAREYTDERFMTGTLESTFEEIKYIFKRNKNIDDSLKKSLILFFERSDFAKYAKMPFPSERMKEDFNMVEAYVEKTKPVVNAEAGS